MNIYKKQGQSVLEYAILLIIIMAALMAIGTYFKRGVQGRWKASVDEMGDQYDPTTSQGNMVHAVSGTSTTTVTATVLDGGQIHTTREDTSDLTETKTGHITVNF